jgi:16S rRNA processing protein RimM
MPRPPASSRRPPSKSLKSDPPGGRTAPGASLVRLGYVSRPNGLRGAVVAHVDPSMVSSFRRGLELELAPRQGAPFRTRVHSAAPIRGGVRLTLEGIGDRNRSEALVGATLSVTREALGPLGEDEHLDTDLIGLEVVTGEGRVLGRLTEVIATGANDVYVVTAEDGGEALVPAVGHAVLDVDLEAGRMTVLAEALEFTPPPAAPAAKPPAASPATPQKEEAPAKPR